MTNDKPAKLIRKLQDLVNAKDDEIARLRADSIRVPERIQTAVDTAVRATVAVAVERSSILIGENQELRLALAGEVIRHDADLRASTDEYVEMVRRNRELTTQLDAATTLVGVCEDALARLRVDNAALQERVDALAPQLALIEEQRVELTKICEGVRDRMRRRELEEENAIMNRRAVAGAIPALNRRA